MEKLEHAEVLLRLGCEQVQGYAISKPMPSSAVKEWVETWKPEAQWKDIKTIESDKLPILYAGIEHRFWIKNIEDALNGIRTKVVPIDKNACHFSHWLSNFKIANKHNNVVFEIDELHSSVHSLANEILELNKSANKDAAQEKLLDLFTLRDRLLDKLHLLLQ